MTDQTCSVCHQPVWSHTPERCARDFLCINRNWRQTVVALVEQLEESEATIRRLAAEVVTRESQRR